MNRQHRHLLIGAFLAFGGLAASLFCARFGKYSDMMIVVFLAGANGAAVSNYFKLARLSASRVAEKDKGDDLVILQLYASLLIGGILAFVAYSLFCGGLVQGSLFPNFANTTLRYTELRRFLMLCTPKTNSDAA